MSAAVNDLIKSIIDKSDVVLFMKGTPNFPQCGFSGQCVQMLSHLDVSYEHVNCLENDEIRQGIKDFSNWPTIPQLYIKGEFVGGSDIVREMFQSGELSAQLTSKGIEHKAPAKA
jgi:monothiol glutaredoxin